MRRGVLGLALGLLLCPGALRPASAQAPTVVHGADVVFAGRGVVIAWAVLRGGGDEASVVLRVTPHAPGPRSVAAELVDPFGGARVVALPPTPLGTGREIRLARARFADHPRLELHFAGATSFTVYFTGVPDATPEFASERALVQYLDSALARAPRP